MSKDEILSKIKKLLALSASFNINEATLAGSKAQELILEYNINSTELDQNEDIIDLFSIYTGKKNGVMWKEQLISGIARYNFCKAIKSGSQPSKVMVVGKKKNRDLVIAVYNNLCVQLDAICDLEFEKSKSSIHGKTWKANFLCGAVVGILDKMRQSRSYQNANPAANAIITVEGKLVEEATQKLFPNTKKGNESAGYFNSDIFNHGVNVGKNVTGQGLLE